MPLASRAASTVALLLILVVGGAFRLYGLNWDAGQHLHPDERFLAIVGDKLRLPSGLLEYFDTARSPLNPYNQGFEGFAYGTAPLFLTRLVAEALGMASYDRINLVGRVLSALFDTATILVTFALGRLVYGTSVGLVAAALLAVTVLHIQLAHFFAVDTFLTFATTLALYAAYRAWLRGGWADFVLLGFAIGLGLSSKLSAALLLPIVGLVATIPPPGETRDQRPEMRVERNPISRLSSLVSRLAACGMAALLVYRVGEPYSFAAAGFWGIWPNEQRFADLSRWVKISSGEIDVPFMIQWAGTPNPWFALDGLVAWGFGPAAGLSALAGLALATWQLRSWPTHGRNLLLVAWAGMNLLYFGFQFAKFLRYLLPAYPALAVLGAYLLVSLAGPLAEQARPRLRPLVRLVPVTVLSATALYAAMFSTIYARPHTRIAASEWIYAHVPTGATLAVEHWDDALPLRLPGRERRYAEVSMELYAEESSEKPRKLADNLARADYVVLSSDRLVGSIPRLPQRFPVAGEYYRLLLSGRLGFELVAEFVSPPQLLGLRIDDRNAQEDFTVYDHPRVRIFKKSDRFSAEDVRTALAAVPLENVQQVKPVEAASRRGLMLSPAEWQRVQAHGTWSASFDFDGLAARLPIPPWLLAVELLAAVTLPICWRLFPRLPDRGFALAKVLGLVVVTYLAWLAAGVGPAPFGRPLILAAVAVLAVGSAVAAFGSRRQMLADLAARRSILLATEIVFLVAFGLMLLIRALNPDLWHSPLGGEKPMDFAYLNAVIKTASFPPYDPWFAAGYINYYYYGFVLVAVLTHLSAVPPAQAYNLAVATLFALTAVLAFAFGMAVAGGPLIASRPRARLGSVAAGLGSAAAVCLLGNLDGAVQLRDALWAAGGDGVTSALPLVTGATRAVAGALAVLAGSPLAPFDFWRSTRFIGPEDPGPIHEFPYFTFLYGDLHAHMISMPLQASVALVGLQLVRTRLPLSRPAARRRRLRHWLAGWRPAAPALALLGLCALLVGSLRATNTWDFPIYLLVSSAAAVLALRPGRAVNWPTAAALGVVLCGALYAGSSLLFLPYLLRYELFYSGVTPVLAKTDLGQFLTIHGLPLFVGLSWLAHQTLRLWVGVRADEPASLGAGAYHAAIAPGLALGTDPRVATAATLLFGLVGLLLIVGRGTLGVALGSGVLVLATALARPRSPERLFLLTLGGGALAAVIVPELVALQGDVGRMNTVFKFYLQAWLLASLLVGPAAVAIIRVFHARRHRSPLVARAWLTTLVVLGVAASVYPLAGTPVRLAQRFSPMEPTLDGMAYMAVTAYSENRRDLNLPADYRAIRWMLQNVRGTPVVLEGQAPLYRWGSRFSVYTGLPTVIGWDWHQKQQRWAYQQRIEQRERDVTTAYETRDPAAARAILRKYDVEYVVVGGLERAYYPPAGLEKFEQMVGNDLEVAYRDGGVTIYRVLGS